MKMIIAAYYEFLKHIRDVKMAAILLIFPILTIYILGNALGDFISMDTTDKKIPVGYINQDTGEIGKALDKFLENEEIQNRLEIINYRDKEHGKKAVDDGEINVIIYLSENLSTGDNQSISIYGEKNVELVESIMNGFVSTYNSVHAVIAISGVPELPRSIDSIERVFYTKDALMPTIIDYYSVLTLLQVLILGAVFGVFIVTKSADSDMHIRIHSLPVSRWSLMVGRIMGSISYLFTASLVVILFTKFVYHANWNGNPFVIFFTLITFCAITVGIGILVGLFVPSFSTAMMIVLLLSIFFGTISGAISPATTGELGIISPNFHAKILLFGTIYGYSNQVMLESALWLGGFMVIIYGISTIFIGRVKYDSI